MIKVRGLQELRKMLEKVDDKLRKKILRRAMSKATRPVIRTARARVPRRTGILRKSIGSTIKRYDKGATWYAAVGARRGFKQRVTHDGREFLYNPTLIQHLVEFGTRRTAAKPFLRPAWDEHSDELVQIMADEIRFGLFSKAGI